MVDSVVPFRYRQNTPDVVSGIATIDDNGDTSAPILAAGKATVLIGVPTIDSASITFLVKPWPDGQDQNRDAVTSDYRTLCDTAGNAVTIPTGTGGKTYRVDLLGGAYAIKIVTSAAQTGGPRLFEVECVGANPTTAGDNSLTIEGTVTVTGTVTANLGTPVTSTTATESGVAASASSVTLLAASATREGCIITNSPTSAVLYVRLSATAASIASGGFSFILNPGDTYEMGANVYSGAITGIWAAATGYANVTES